MARDVATKWILGIVIYFIILSLIFTVSNSIAIDYELDTNSSLSSSGGSNTLILEGGLCDNPRFDYKDSIIPSVVNSPKYSVMQGEGLIYDQESCEAFSGASWIETTFLFFWGTGNYKCDGLINQTYYNEGVAYANTTFIQLWDKSPCGLSLLQEDEGLCESFGCTYYTEDSLKNLSDKNAVSGFWNVLKTIKDVATLRINFGFDSSLLNGFLTFMFIWLPIILLIISIYVMIR